MNPLFLLASIGRTIAGILAAPGVAGGAVQQWAGVLGIAANIAGRVDAAMHSPELQLLCDQIDEAVAAGRGLTDQQRAEWQAKSDAYSAEIQELAGRTPSTAV